MRYLSLLLLALICAGSFFTSSCASSKYDAESESSVLRSDELYTAHVNGGLTPAQAEQLVVDLVKRYDVALGADPARSTLVKSFEHDLRQLVTTELSVETAQKFFDAALRYERSKR